MKSVKFYPFFLSLKFLIFSFKSYIYFLLLFLTLFSSLACVSYNSSVHKSNRLLYGGKPSKAISFLKKLAEKPGKNQLAYLLDYATLLQITHQYEKSVEAFLKAEKIAEVKDYHSLSRISASILLNEAQMQYKGDDYEKLLIHVMLAINFLLLEKKESALVETRKLNEKLYLYKHEAKKNYEQNVLAYYLAGIIWESDKKWEDAYLDYKMAYDLNLRTSDLREDLVRLSALAGHWKEHKKWVKEFNIPFKKEWKDPSFGELIFIFQQGRSPKKKPHPDFDRVPKLFPSYSFIKKFLLEVFQYDQGLKPFKKGELQEIHLNRDEIKKKKEKPRETIDIQNNKIEGEKREPAYHEISQVIYSVEDVAIKTLNDKYNQLVLKRLSGILAKELLAREIKKENEALGTLIQLGLHLLDRADLRQWSNLPETFQITRFFLKKGTYRIKVSGLKAQGNRISLNPTEEIIEISGQKKHFYHLRSFH